jgi:autotransporter-associated beta strand protein
MDASAHRKNTRPIAAVHWARFLVAVAAAAVPGVHALGQVDNLAPVLTTNWFLGSSLAAFTYDPTADTMFVTAYGNPSVVKVSGVTPPATQAAGPTVYETTLQLFYRDGDPNRSVTLPLQGGILLNPKPVGGNAAFSFALIADGGNTRYPASTTVDPAASKKFYTYNLGTAAISGTGTDVFTTRVTLANLQSVAGSTATSTSLARQFAWSGDGQSIYFVDSSPGYGGLWKLGALAGNPQRILAADMENTEPGVRSAGGIDTIFFSGGSGNLGGIDFVTHDGAATSGRQTRVSSATLAGFFEVSGTMPSQRIQSLTTVGDDLYFLFYTNASGTKPESRHPGIYRYDAQGRLSKVVNRTQRAAALGGVNLVFDRLQSRAITFSGSSGDFPVTQLLYREGGVNTVAGATVFKPVDFNRDNVVTAADLSLLVPQVTVRGQVKAAVADLTFDMNGNDTVDWKDVQIVEGFLDYAPDPTLAGRIVPTLPIQADADLNGVVDFNDFQVMRGNYNLASQAFTQGDFNGDNQVSFPDLQPWINSYGFRSAVVGASVPMAPFDQATWSQFLAGVAPPSVTLDVPQGRQTQFQAGYRTIVIAESVTKTGTGSLVFDTANSYSGTTSVAAGTLELAAAGAVAASTLRVGPGATVIVANGIDATAAGLDLAGGSIDVTTGAMTVSAGLSPVELVAGIVAGRGDGTWTGQAGITSAAVAADVARGIPRAVGWLDSGDGSVRFSYSAPGDTNIDFAVDILDAANFLALGKFDSGTAASWIEGDFSYDGIVDILDAADFFATGLFDTGSYGPSAALAVVPEPAFVAVLPIAGGLIALAARRAAAEGRDRPGADRRRGGRRPRRSG